MNFNYQKDYWQNFAKNGENNDLAKDLHSSWDEGKKIYTSHTEIPEKFLELIPNKKSVLDVGIGFGRNTDYLRSKFTHVVGFDTPEMIENTKKNVGSKALCLSNWDEVADLKFDLIYQSIAIQHMPPQEVIYYLMVAARISPYFFSYTRSYNDYMRDFKNSIGGVNISHLVDSINCFELICSDETRDNMNNKMDETHYCALYRSKFLHL